MHVCVRTHVAYICFTSKCLCYESLPGAEQMTVNGTISETWRVKGGIQIKVRLASHLLSLHLHNYSWDTKHSCVYVRLWRSECVRACVHPTKYQRSQRFPLICQGYKHQPCFPPIISTHPTSCFNQSLCMRHMSKGGELICLHKEVHII